MIDHIKFGSETIEYTLQYTNRKTLGITIKPDMSVHVTSPMDVPQDRIKERLRLKAPWILKQKSFFLAFHPKTPERKYVSGETHFYFGRQYRLKIHTGEKESVKLKGKFIEVSVIEKSKASSLVNAWYLDHARHKFNILAAPLIAQFSKYNVHPTSIILRNMPSRWGSCTPKGKIILNPELIKAPKRCIEYVIIHELCHLVHYDHTQKFIDLQTKEMPDWSKWKNKLENMMV
jgi:predicted metal-dependent hydrolase